MKAKKLRIDDLIGRLKTEKNLDNDEYLLLLQGIRRNCTIQMYVKSQDGVCADLQTLGNAIDKVHWLIDSMEKRIPTTHGVLIEFKEPPTVEASA